MESINDIYYDVDRIVRKRRDGTTGETIYMVKWTGFSSKHNSWVFRKDFVNSSAIDIFEEKERHRHNRQGQMSGAKKQLQQEDEGEDKGIQADHSGFGLFIGVLILFSVSVMLFLYHML